MYLPEPHPTSSTRALELLETASADPTRSVQEDPEIRAAFEEGLRQLAEDIVEHNPGLAHLLLGMGEAPSPSVHGQN
ncbi:MAG: hypothetical protein VXX36_11085 [Verrucomicrobiota bacterium]|nr:hypothetical protein [Verrucomicrobiota bacterium]